MRFVILPRCLLGIQTFFLPHKIRLLSPQFLALFFPVGLFFHLMFLIEDYTAKYHRIICYLCCLLSNSNLWEVQSVTAMRELYQVMNEVLV